MMGAWSSEPYLLIQDEENSNGQRVSMHRGHGDTPVVEMRCRANVQQVNGYQPSVDRLPAPRMSSTERYRQAGSSTRNG